MTEIIPVNPTTIQLAPLPQSILPAISQFITALGIPREVLASEEEIECAWRDLPRELRSIPNINLKGELIIKMCIAVSVGLFDSAINYAWNAAILQLREKVKNFGLEIVSQILSKNFEEKHLLELQDSELLDICLKLNLATEDGYFFLDQCRSTRNNFSAAHPTIGQLDDREFIVFLKRCVKYALAESTSPRGIHIGTFISAVKTSRFTEGQCSLWLERIDATHDAQRDLLFSMIHGIYCDPTTLEPVRLNIIDLCLPYSEKFTSSIRSKLIIQHSEYRAKGDIQRSAISQQFFDKIGLFTLLDDCEKHTIISKVLNQLWNVHQAWNNFYNEPPFAERLAELSKKGLLPKNIQEEFVEKVVGCYIGNGHGVSEMAKPFYEEMIREFSPKEIQHMVEITRKNSSIVARRINSESSCRIKFIQALKLIDASSVPDAVRVSYENLIGIRRSY
ncbi:hypothetical protein A4S05_01710 [Nostoc sp. KVJ20]|uniref:hypothetical protein n=1 Tax=Nostoc sp. KVJ20 TaxID=457944 RepID=UPI00083E2B5C|nr:hypothetical protein [Nostoc sp. KVJ20]ODG97125.1 hypothetical protein A4S05_01710 [Nostoc sp. KVJ20]